MRAELSEKYIEEETSSNTRLAEIVQQRRSPNERRPASCLSVSQVLLLCSRTLSPCHMFFYQGHLHTPLTEVSFQSRGSCTPMPLVRGRCRSLRVLVLLCRLSQGVVDRCELQNEYPRHIPFFSDVVVLYRQRLLKEKSTSNILFQGFKPISNYFFL